MKSHVHVTTTGTRRYHLKSAILIYASDNHEDVYATHHPVEFRRKQGALLGPGVPATTEGCAAFVRAIADRGQFAGFLSPLILYTGPRVVTWWRPPSPRRVWFETEARSQHNIGTRSAITAHPGLVFTLANGRWSVRAVKGADRPTPDTPMWVAPYFNCGENGAICEGNVERPKTVTPETIAGFEAAFFDSRFTHPNIHRAREFCTFKGGPYGLWKHLLDLGDAGRTSTFPERALVNAKATLEQHIKTLEENKIAR